MGYVEEYLEFIESEKSHKICKQQKQLAKMIRSIFTEEADEIYIDEERVEKYLSYQKYFDFDLFEWEKFILVLMLCTFYKESGLPRFNTLFCLVGRGSGKNALISYLVFCLTTPTNGIQNYNIDIVANSEQQAMTSFFDIYNVLSKPNLKDKMKKNFKWNKQEIRNKKTNSVVRYKTSNAKSQDGLRPGCVVYDEVHQYENWKLIDVARTGLGKIDHPRQFYITTDGHVRDAVLDELKDKSRDILNGSLDDNGFLPFICKLDSEEEVHDESCWYKANPSLIYRPSLLKQIQNEYVDYKLSPFTNISFIVKRMNIAKCNESAPITDYENIKATNQPIPYEELNGLYCTVGIDFSTISDTVGVSICIKKNCKHYIISHTFMNKNSKDLPKIKAPLEEWAEMGLLTFTEGVENDPRDVFQWIQETTEKYDLMIDGIAIDLYRLSIMKRTMEDFGYEYDDKEFTKLVRPSDIMLAVPMIDSLFNNKKLVVGDSPIWRWSANNTQLLPKANGNFVYEKIDPFRRKNDTFMSTVHAIIISDRLTDWDEQDDFFFWQGGK